MNFDFMSIKEASEFASELVRKNITVANINYLIQYNRIKKYTVGDTPCVSIDELKEYYTKQIEEKNKLRESDMSINWELAFDKYKEAETTKHVHRLHPYKGKFIPQLVDYFIDEHTDEFKKESFFKKGDIILDPFCGSGTTMVQANECGLHCIGIDISEFNAMISNCKVEKYDIDNIKKETDRIINILSDYVKNSNIPAFEKELSFLLSKYNAEHFPNNKNYKNIAVQKENKEYIKQKETDFLHIYGELLKKHNIITKTDENPDGFIAKWYMPAIIDEINIVNYEIDKIENPETKKIVQLILSRTIRTSRATTHYDLATIFEPVFQPYFCGKHGKICKPLFSMLKWFKTYVVDTIKRLVEFDGLRTNTFQICLTGNAQNLDITKTSRQYLELHSLLKAHLVDGIFSSPPYVGLIDYHEQHAYAYDLFGFKRQDMSEIGSLMKGQTKDACEKYVEEIANVLINSKKFLKDDYNILLVANDKYNLYSKIAEKAGMKIIQEFKRPVINRSEKNKNVYSETIFHMKEQARG